MKEVLYRQTANHSFFFSHYLKYEYTAYLTSFAIFYQQKSVPRRKTFAFLPSARVQPIKYLRAQKTPYIYLPYYTHTTHTYVRPTFPRARTLVNCHTRISLISFFSSRERNWIALMELHRAWIDRRAIFQGRRRQTGCASPEKRWRSALVILPPRLSSPPIDVGICMPITATFRKLFSQRPPFDRSQLDFSLLDAYMYGKLFEEGSYDELAREHAPRKKKGFHSRRPRDFSRCARCSTHAGKEIARRFLTGPFFGFLSRVTNGCICMREVPVYRPPPRGIFQSTCRSRLGL